MTRIIATAGDRELNMMLIYGMKSYPIEKYGEKIKRSWRKRKKEIKNIMENSLIWRYRLWFDNVKREVQKTDVLRKGHGTEWGENINCIVTKSKIKYVLYVVDLRYRVLYV